MQVTIDVNTEGLGSSVADLFQSLTTEQRQDLCLTVMREVLAKPSALERKNYEAKLVADLIAQYSTSTDRWDRITNEQEARTHAKFRDQMKGWKSSSEVLIATITEEAVRTWKEKITALVTADVQLQALYDEQKKVLVQQFPQVLQGIMASYFAAQMAQIGSGLMQAWSTEHALKHLSQSLQQQLSAQGIHISPPQV